MICIHIATYKFNLMVKKDTIITKTGIIEALGGGLNTQSKRKNGKICNYSTNMSIFVG